MSLIGLTIVAYINNWRSGGRPTKYAKIRNSHWSKLWSILIICTELLLELKTAQNVYKISFLLHFRECKQIFGRIFQGYSCNIHDSVFAQQNLILCMERTQVLIYADWDSMRSDVIVYIAAKDSLQDNSPTNQLAVSQVADWITRGPVNSPTANF